MRKTLICLFTMISLAASAQEIENVLDTTKTTSRDFAFGLKNPAANFNSPLFILGDMEINQDQLSKINPDHINSITVLKEASAVEKYGEKGKHGVIIIQTKKSPFNLKERFPVDDNKQ